MLFRSNSSSRIGALRIVMEGLEKLAAARGLVTRREATQLGVQSQVEQVEQKIRVLLEAQAERKVREPPALPESEEENPQSA